MKKNNYQLICDIAKSMGKNNQDIANWRFSGKVPKSIRFEIYCNAKSLDGTELSEKDFENFQK